MLSRNVIRNFASAATARSSASSLNAVEESVSKLDNGLTVASVDFHGAVSQFVIASRAGSRYEQPNEVGLVHHLRNCIGSDSAQFPGVKLLWQSGNIGSNLVATASKDLLCVQISSSRTFAEIALSLLDEFSKPAFKPWDVVEAKKNLITDLQHQEPLDLLVELLHKAAYRNGPLGNALLSPLTALGQNDFRKLSAFANSRLVPSETVVVGVNIDHSVLLQYVSSQEQKQCEAPNKAPSSKYFGGDVRLVGRTNLAHVAIAGQGAKLSDTKGVAVQSVLSFIVGKGANVKYANTPGIGPVAKNVLQAANHNSVGVNALNVVHSDDGLAGVYLVAEGDKIGLYVKAAVAGLKELASSGPDEETLAVAKKLVEVKTHVNSQNSSQVAFDRAALLLASNNAPSLAEFEKAVQGVTADDVKKAAAQITSKLSIAAYGKINQVPYVDEL